MQSTKPKTGLSIFVVTPNSTLNGRPADLSDINGISCRKRKRHHKIRSGCTACRLHRVKCDTKFPVCGHCKRRREHCSLANYDPLKETRQNGLVVASRTISHSRYLRPALPITLCDSFDVHQLELFHNFVTNTAKTLPFGGSVWIQKVVPLALRSEYLLHAILLLSAKQLSCLCQNPLKHRKNTYFHLSKLLPGYRKDMAKPMSIANADSVLATNLLLQYFFWSNFDDFAIEDPSCFIKDQMFALLVGVRETFLSASPLLFSGQSIFSESTTHHTKDEVMEAANTSCNPPKYFLRRIFEKYAQWHFKPWQIEDESTIKSNELLRQDCKGLYQTSLWYSITESHDQVLLGFLEAATRLAPLLSIASELKTQSARDHNNMSLRQVHSTNDLVLPGESNLTVEDLARYVFTWPTLSSPGALHLLKIRDPSMVVLLYHLYEAIRTILPLKYWWAHERANTMIKIIHAEFGSILDLDVFAEFMVPESVANELFSFALASNEKWRRDCIAHAMAHAK